MTDEINQATKSRKDDVTKFDSGVADTIKEYVAAFEPIEKDKTANMTAELNEAIRARNEKFASAAEKRY